MLPYKFSPMLGYLGSLNRGLNRGVYLGVNYIVFFITRGEPFKQGRNGGRYIMQNIRMFQTPMILICAVIRYHWFDEHHHILLT